MKAYTLWYQFIIDLRDANRPSPLLGTAYNDASRSFDDDFQVLIEDAKAGKPEAVEWYSQYTAWRLTK